MSGHTKSIFHPGRLFLIPTGLGNQAPLEVLPLSIRKKITEINHYIVENEKTARKFIKSVVSNKQQSSLKFELLNKFTPLEEIPTFLNPCKEGHDVGLLSEAGCPGIADPGAQVVKLAHQDHVKVVPLVGPSSIILTMMSSGMNGQNFAFNGYLPIEKSERKHEIKRLERLSSEQNQAQIFIETPYRNDKLLNDFLQYLHPSTNLCIGCDVTLTTEFICTQRIADWKKAKMELHKRPAIFIIQRD
ncbi:MAG TPA: SAM-dependent methyltransferase [Flavobacteriaceae bacterium]|nr:SAM-dependent methyltransferase [Flavobacteriaceae bacterium]